MTIIRGIATVFLKSLLIRGVTKGFFFLQNIRGILTVKNIIRGTQKGVGIK